MNETFEQTLCRAINMHSKEYASDTPDFILTQYLIDCLDAFSKAVHKRDEWYGDGH